jgi:hypothetical protein
MYIWSLQKIVVIYASTTEGASRATGITSPEAKSNGKLCALRSCITSMPRSARLMMSAHVLITRPSESMTAWLKSENQDNKTIENSTTKSTKSPSANSCDYLLNPLRLKAMVEIPIAVNQIPRTGHNARKKCSARELLKDAYWKMRRPKYPWAATIL